MRPSIALLLITCLAAPAVADPAVAFHVVVDDHGHRRIVIDTPVDVSVRAPRPEVAVLGATKRVDYVWPLVEESMLKLVLASVHHQPFEAAPVDVGPGGSAP